MKILIVSAMFPPIRTGTSFYVQNMASALKKRNNQITVVTVENEDARKENNPFPVIRLPAFHFPLKNFFKHLRFSSVYLRNFKKMNAVMAEMKPDVVLLVNHYLDIAFPVLYATKRQGIPLVISVGTQITSISPLKEMVLNFFDWLICGNVVFRFCDKIISWDREIHKYIQNIHSDEIVKKSCIVPFGPNGDESAFEKADHDYSRNNQIIAVGSVIEQRNNIFLIHLFKRLSEIFPNLILKIVGHVYYQEAVQLTKQLHLEEKVVFTGELPHEKVLEEVSKSAFYWVALSGKYIGLGTASLEAMLMGVPVVSNVYEDLLGKPILKDMDNYVYADGVSIEPAVTKLTFLLRDQKLREKIGKNGRRVVKENMNWGLVAEAMEDVFSRGLNEKG